MKPFEKPGVKGVKNTSPCTVLIMPVRYGYWYAVQGGTNVNFTHQDLSEMQSISVEEIEDVDYFHWQNDINTLEELEEAVNA